MPRLFVCVWPPHEVVEELHRLPRPQLDGVRWVDPETWHVTLRFIGDAAADEVVERLSDCHLPGATLRLGPAVDLLSDRHLVVPVTGADALARAVGDATAGIGERDTDRFRGHLTLARSDRHAARALTGTPVAATFEVAEVALVSSDLQPGGPIYSTVAVFATA